jgi:hypothetical protein
MVVVVVVYGENCEFRLKGPGVQAGRQASVGFLMVLGTDAMGSAMEL